MVPKHLRDAVWSTYRPGQEVDKRPTAEYLDAADEACRIVEKKERKRRAKQDHAKAQQSLFGGDS